MLYSQLYLKYNLHFSYLICSFHSIYPKLTHNKHFIRHNVPHNKVLIISKSPFYLPRQTIFDTNRPIPHLLIRILHLPPDWLRPPPKISLHLLPVCCCQVRTNKNLLYIKIPSTGFYICLYYFKSFDKHKK